MKINRKILMAVILAGATFICGCGDIASWVPSLPSMPSMPSLPSLPSLPFGVEQSSDSEKQKETEAVQSVTALTVGGTDIAVEEAMVYAFLMQQPLVEAAGDVILESVHPDGGKINDRMEAEVKKQITEITLLASAAQEEGLELSEEEKENVAQRAALLMTQYPALVEAGVGEDDAVRAYGRSMLAGKYYDQMTADYVPDLTEAEKASCSVREIAQIFVAAGDTSHLGKYENAEALMKALLKQAKGDADFMVLSETYSSAGTQTVVVLNDEGYAYDADAWIDENFTAAAVRLEEGGLSGVITTPMGLHILKCISVDDPDLRAGAEAALFEKKKQNYFSDIYETMLADTVIAEGEGWQEISGLLIKGD